MYPETINLLPEEKKRSFKRNYLLRLITMSVLVLALLVVIHGVLLLPSYLYVTQEVKGKATQLDTLTRSLATVEEKQVQARLSALQQGATTLASLEKTPVGTKTLNAILLVPRPGIRLTGFTFTPPAGSKSGTMQVSGVASTRESLRSYDAALGALPFVSNADLPISNYAQESNIPFTITLTGSLMP